jgi:hypothetical protein
MRRFRGYSIPILTSNYRLSFLFYKGIRAYVATARTQKTPFIPKGGLISCIF